MRKNFQFVLLFLQTFIERHLKFIILGILLGFLGTLFTILASGLFYAQIFTQRNIKIAIVGNFSEDSLPLYIQNQIGLGLIKLEPSGQALPALSSSWEIDDKGINYTFHLNNNIFFNDGTKFTSHDFNFKLKGAEINSPDDYTIKIKLKEPYSPLPVILSKPILKSSLIGVGDYKVIKTRYTGDVLSELILQPNKSGYPTLTYKIYPTTEEALHAFKMGEIKMLYQIPGIGSIKSWKNLKIIETSLYDRYLILFYNLKSGMFKDKETRQALAYALPKFNNEENVISPISPLSWAYSNKVRFYRNDPETAQKILSKSEIASSSSSITITTYSALLPIAQSIAEAWKNVGVKTKVRAVTSIPSDYEVFLSTQIIPPDPDQYQLWHSTQELTNLSHYSNLKIDKLLEDGRKTVDTEKRKKVYGDFQRYLVDDAPVSFLYYPKVYTVERL